MIVLPVAANSLVSKMAFCHRAIKRLELWYNEESAKVNHNDPAAAISFRTWVREQWEPRHKAVCLTLHSLEGFSQEAPQEEIEARSKKTEGVAVSAIEQAALDLVDSRVNARTADDEDSSWDGWIDPEKFPRLNVLGEPPDPPEDFTTYTSVDPGASFSISASQISFTSMDIGLKSYVYKDMGEGHFSANFTHIGDMQMSLPAPPDFNTFPPFWMLANDLGIWYNDLQATDKPYLICAQSYQDGSRAHLEEGLGGSRRYDFTAALTWGTQYWTKVIRDEDVGTYGTIYAYWYSDSGRTTLVKASSVSLRAKTNFRYVEGLNSGQVTSTRYVSGLFANLDLGEPIFVGALKKFDSSSDTWKKEKMKVATSFGSGDFEHKLLKIFNADRGAWECVDTTLSE